MKRTQLHQFDLTDKSDRARARRMGFDVPLRVCGVPPKDFWSCVNKGAQDECWPWRDRVNKDGYGEYAFEGKKWRAHRVAFVKQFGTDIKGKVILHSCDNPPCCNPFHLSIGTHQDNQHDKVLKERQAVGETIATSVLTEETVRDIRRRYVPRQITMQSLASEYGVCVDTIRKCVARIYWNHVA